MAAAADAPGFAAALIGWFARERRDLPWRRERSPYGTWVSEIMLQQTTVDVVRDRYLAFLARWPDVARLAAAEEEEVVQEWAGLGYYRRARALHRGARVVMEEHGGALPEDEAELRALPGVGDYTAAAIRALGFGLPAAPVDGNVARVMSRVTADDGDVGRAPVRRRLAAALRERLAEDDAARFCEAMIELGALICRPQSPACDTCPVAAHCAARKAGNPEDYPVKKAARAAIPITSFRALVRRRDAVLLVRRPDDATLLPGFLELPGRWTPGSESAAEILGESLSELGLRAPRVGPEVATARHAITHHRITARAHACEASGDPEADHAAFHALGAIDRRHLTTETRKLLKAEEQEA